MSGFKNILIRCGIRRMRVDGSRIRKEKVADSKISGYVWTGTFGVQVKQTRFFRSIYRLTHSAGEFSGFNCTSSPTMNENWISIQHEAAGCVFENFEFIVSERVQVNPDNSRAISALTFLLFKLNTLQTKIVKLRVSRSHIAWWQWCVEFTPRLLHHDNDVKEVVSPQPNVTWYKSSNQKIGIRTVYESWII